MGCSKFKKVFCYYYYCLKSSGMNERGGYRAWQRTRPHPNKKWRVKYYDKKIPPSFVNFIKIGQSRKLSHDADRRIKKNSNRQSCFSKFEYIGQDPPELGNQFPTFVHDAIQHFPLTSYEWRATNSPQQLRFIFNHLYSSTYKDAKQLTEKGR